MPPQRRHMLVSNRLPIVVSQDALTATWQITPAVGGLVTALAPILRDHGGVWIGWTGLVDGEDAAVMPLLAQESQALGYTLQPVPLTQDERDTFYFGFANEIIWPLFHEVPTRGSFEPRYWDGYRTVNRSFAQTIAAQDHEDAAIWVHDYHLMHVAADLRVLGVSAPIRFFLHIPFPAPSIFAILPWRDAVIDALLAYDDLGFQTPRDVAHFLACVRLRYPYCAIAAEATQTMLRIDDRLIRVGAYPISVDAADFLARSQTSEVTERVAAIRESFPGQHLLLGIDRLDYTKGIPQRLRALNYALEHYPALRGAITLIQIVVPSRTAIPEYADLKMEIDQLVGQINSQWARLGWVPIHYLYRMQDETRLLAYYRAADVALVTPLKDGMNLVAKEYCICTHADGVLVLSEFAGAASQLGADALLVNPYDIAGCAAAIHRAVTMPTRERQARMRRLKQQIHGQDIFAWLAACLARTAPDESGGEGADDERA
ncbi:MAG TPA: trehalose-6-phosphate synthase [Herpetosiphonaceae bacterium]|nr:trehalose-6-phosphate synthase [Herpetosiphonaceae bacterium]